jgi:hypothetical protein
MTDTLPTAYLLERKCSKLLLLVNDMPLLTFSYQVPQLLPASKLL